MGNVSEIKSVFTVDLTPFVDGLKTMLSMTATTTQQMKAIMTLDVKTPNLSGLESQLKGLTERTKDYLKEQAASVPIVDGAASAERKFGGETDNAGQAVKRKTESLRHMKRESLETFGAISFLAINIINLASSADKGNEKLRKLSSGMSQGISAGFGLAGVLGMLGLATGGVAAAIGGVVAIGVSLLSFFDDAAERAARTEKSMKAYIDTLRGANLQDLVKEAAYMYRMAANATEADQKAYYTKMGGAIRELMDPMLKTGYEATRFVEQATTDAITDQFEKRRVAATQAHQREQEDYRAYQTARIASDKKYAATIQQINKDEADWKKSQNTKLNTEIKNDFNDQVRQVELATQRKIALTQLAGIEQKKTESQIAADVIKTKQQAAKDELDILLIKQEEQITLGKDSSREELLRKAELETQLTTLATEGAEARKKIAQEEAEKKKDYNEATMQGVTSIANNLANAAQTMMGIQQQQTTKEVNEEKKRRLAVLDAEKVKRLAAATTSEEKQKIEEEYSAKKDALDAEMEAKAKEKNRSAFETQKAFSIASAIIATYEMATKAYNALAGIPIVGPFLAVAAAAAAIIAGLANVAEIKAQEVPGLKEGGDLPKGKRGFIEGDDDEFVAPKRTFLQLFRSDLMPEMVKVMTSGNARGILLPQIREEVLAASSSVLRQNVRDIAAETVRSMVEASQAGLGGNFNNDQRKIEIHIHIDKLFGDQNLVKQVIKPAIEASMRELGANSVTELFVNKRKI